MLLYYLTRLLPYEVLCLFVSLRNTPGEVNVLEVFDALTKDALEKVWVCGLQRFDLHSPYPVLKLEACSAGVGLLYRDAGDVQLLDLL
jgi:hypothetical protein